MNDHNLKQWVHFPTREKNTLDWIIGQVLDIQIPDRLTEEGLSLSYHKGDYESMGTDAFELYKNNVRMLVRFKSNSMQ